MAHFVLPVLSQVVATVCPWFTFGIQITAPRVCVSVCGEMDKGKEKPCMYLHVVIVRLCVGEGMGHLPVPIEPYAKGH